MKKNAIYALMSAIALTGSIGFSSCSSDDKVAGNPNPGYDAVKNEVPVEFLFNVGSYGSGASTRQSADATQADNNLKASKFRGIEGARILCFQQATNGQYITSSTSGETAVKAAKDFNMARVAQAGSLGYSSDGTSSNTTRVLEMTFPLGVNSMMFYGKAITEETGDYEDIYGHLDEYEIDEDLTKVTFALGRRLASEKKTEFLHIQNLLAAILTCVMETNRGTSAVNATDVPETDVDPYGFAIPVETAEGLKWRNYYENYIAGTALVKPKSPVDGTTVLTQLEEKLAKAYKEMTTIQTAELRNGSGLALIATIKNLWGIVNSVRCAEPTSNIEAVAKYMAQRIHAELERYFEPTFGEIAKVEGGAPSAVSFKNTLETLIPNIKNDPFWPGGAFDESSVSGITSANNNLNTFPATFKVPQGSTHIKFNRAADNTDPNYDQYMPAGTPQYAFYYVQNYNSSAVGNGQFTVDDYYYPAELLYFGNSPIRVSDDEHAVLEYPQNTTAWDSETQATTDDPWYGWKWGETDGVVTSSTRSVAMRNDINYGTALLDITVGYFLPEDGKLKDNNAAIQLRDYQTTEPDHTIVPTETSFKLVGILVGGQSPRIGWNMLPALKTEERQGYIFDDEIAFNTIPTSGTSDHNYTMVFDNYNATLADDAQEDVYIALEFTNNSGMDFFGRDNLITNGSNFYLIGKLDPKDKTAPDLPAYHALPPYKNKEGTDLVYVANANPAKKTIPRVFIQDHKTMVNFKIGENSLKSAYLTVPDLRSSSVTLGLSVDMSWSTGLEFDNVILGGN